jgi:PAS domain S-box-containing protein
VVRAFVEHPTRRVPAKVLAALEGPPQADRLVAIQLRDREGRILAQSGSHTEKVAALTTPEIDRIVRERRGSTVGSFRAMGDTVVYPVVAAISDSGTAHGYVVHWRRQASNPTSRDQIASLFGGPGSRLLVTDTTQVIWTDLVERVDAPPMKANPDSGVARYDLPGKGARFAVAAQTRAGPWIALIEVPRSGVMQPADTFLRRMAGIAAVLLTLGLVASSVITRKITRPISELALAADAVNQGEYGRRVETSRTDELGMLAGAVNRLATGVQSTHQEREERFRLLVEAVRDYAIFALDAEGNVVSWNSGANRLKGYTRDEIVGRHFSTFYPAEDIAAGKPARELKEATELGRVEDEGWRIRKDGSRFWANVIITALRDAEGELVGFAKVTRDMTERVRAEEDLRQTNLALRERTVELDRALVQLKDAQQALVRREKLAILGQLASGVGHELRNPLGVMTNALYYLDAVIADPPANVKEYLGILRNQVDLSEKIVSDLLDFARVKPPQRQAVPLGGVVDRQLEGAGPMKNITVRTDIPPAVPPAFADQVQVGQVVLNLLTNAIQAIGDRGGSIAVRAGVTNGLVRLEVSDNGHGIPAENLQRIFEPLFTTKARGMGLGLAVSRALAIANGGDITVESAEGKGSTFTLTLPVAENGKAE